LVERSQKDWEELHYKTFSQLRDVRYNAIYSVHSVFNDISSDNKKQAWQDLIRLTADPYNVARTRAFLVLISVFQSLPNDYKMQAWQDLIELTAGGDYRLRWHTANFMGSAIKDIPENYKRQAWQDYIKLTAGLDNYVRMGAAHSLGSAFRSIPNDYKDRAWQDLIRLTAGEDDHLRWYAARSLGLAFQSISNDYIEQAWLDLIRLTIDQDKVMLTYVYHSLGQASVFKATMAVDDKAFQENLEKAIEFFERSSQESEHQNYDHPAEFCLPFYRSFFAITFQEANSQEQVNRYLRDAKKAVAQSKSRELLLEAVNNLSQALQEARSVSGLQEKKADLKACQQYCEKAAELLDETEGMVPGASGVVRRGLPIINKMIKEILGQIEDQSKRFCQTTRDTPFEEFGSRAYKQTIGLQEIESPVVLEIRLTELVPLLQMICHVLPATSSKSLCRQLSGMKNLEPEAKGDLVLNVLISISTRIANLTPEELKQYDVDGLIYSNELEIEIGNIFKSVYQKERERGENEAGSKTLKSLGETLRALSISGREFKWLDVGCGDGRCLDVLYKVPDRSKINYYGIDNFYKYLDEAETRARSYGLEAMFSKMDAAKMKFDSEFDLVSAVLVLHEIDPLNLPYVLRNMIRSLREDGTLIISDFQGPYEQEMNVVSWSYEDLAFLVNKVGESKMDGEVMPSSVCPSELGFYRCIIKGPKIDEDRFKGLLQGYDKFLDEKKKNSRLKLKEMRAQIKERVQEILQRQDIDYKTLTNEDMAKIKAEIPQEYGIKAQKIKLLTNEIMFLDDKIDEFRERGSVIFSVLY